MTLSHFIGICLINWAVISLVQDIWNSRWLIAYNAVMFMGNKIYQWAKSTMPVVIVYWDKPDGQMTYGKSADRLHIELKGHPMAWDKEFLVCLPRNIDGGLTYKLRALIATRLMIHEVVHVYLHINQFSWARSRKWNEVAAYAVDFLTVGWLICPGHQWITMYKDMHRYSMEAFEGEYLW